MKVKFLTWAAATKKTWSGVKFIPINGFSELSDFILSLKALFVKKETLFYRRVYCKM